MPISLGGLRLYNSGLVRESENQNKNKNNQRNRRKGGQRQFAPIAGGIFPASDPPAELWKRHIGVSLTPTEKSLLSAIQRQANKKAKQAKKDFIANLISRQKSSSFVGGGLLGRSVGNKSKSGRKPLSIWNTPKQNAAIKERNAKASKKVDDLMSKLSKEQPLNHLIEQTATKHAGPLSLITGPENRNGTYPVGERGGTGSTEALISDLTGNVIPHYTYDEGRAAHLGKYFKNNAQSKASPQHEIIVDEAGNVVKPHQFHPDFDERASILPPTSQPLSVTKLPSGKRPGEVIAHKKAMKAMHGNIRRGKSRGSNKPGASYGVPLIVHSNAPRYKPRQKFHADGSITVMHREPLNGLGDVYGTTAFTTAALNFNPGLAAVTPWAADIAKRFTSYRVNSMRAIYTTMKGADYGGRVCMSVDYDSHDSAPTSMTEAVSVDDRNFNVPGVSFATVLKRKNLQGRAKKYYVRQDGVPSGADRNDFDCFDLHVSTLACTDTSLMGTIDLEYSITFSTPTSLNSNVGIVYGGKVTANGSITKTAPLGITPSIDPDALGFTAYDNSGTSAISINNPGFYMLHLYCAGTNPTAISAGLTNGTLTSLNSFMASSSAVMASADYTILSTATHGNPSVFTFSYTATTITGGHATLASLPADSAAIAAARMVARPLPQVEEEKSMFESSLITYKQEKEREYRENERESRALQALRENEEGTQSCPPGWLAIKKG